MSRVYVGVDVGGTTVKIGFFSEDDELLEKWEVKTDKSDNGKNILRDVAASIKEKAAAEGHKILGVGMGVPGPVREDGYIEVCVNLGWHDVNAQDELSDLLDGVPVLSGNDANVAALGEMWQGGGKGYKDVVLYTLGTGVGGGIIKDRRIINGRHGLGGELGHIRIREGETETCNCGQKGCLEQVASATGIAREARRAMAATEAPSMMRQFGDKIIAKDVLDCAKAGDPLAIQVMETVCYYLGWACSMMQVTVDPEAFVFGGGVSKAGTYLTDMIEKYYHKFSKISKYKAEVKLAQLGNDAGIYGAARLIIGE